MYLEFLTAAVEGDPWVRRQMLAPVAVAQVERGVRSAGGTVLLQEEVVPGPTPGGDPAERSANQRRGCRMVVEWRG